MSTEMVKHEETAVSRPLPGLVPSSLTDALKLAEVMAKGRLVPQHLQGQVSDCLMVIEQAMRWGMSPFAVAQATSVISGKLMYEGKLVAAVINARGDLEDRLSFTYDGNGNDRTCTASGRMRGEKEARTATVRLGDVKTGNKMWQTQPDQQLVYSASRVWARRHMPELMLGVYAPEEFDQPLAPVATYTPPKAQTQQASPPSAASAPPSAEPAANSTAREPGADDDEWPDEPTVEYVPCYAQDEKSKEWFKTDDFPKATKAQIGEIHRLLHVLKTSDEVYRRRLRDRYNKASSTELSKDEAGEIISSMRERHNNKTDKQNRKARQAVQELAQTFQEMGVDVSEEEHPTVTAAKTTFGVG